MEAVKLDLVALFALPMPLLDACVGGEVATFRALREVNKTASLAVLRAHLYDATLTFTGQENDTRVEVARMLPHLGLGRVTVQLQFSESFNSAVELMAFLVTYGCALGCVTTLDLHLDKGECTAYASCLLDCAVAALLYACPVLNTLNSTAQLSTHLIHSMAEACPRVSVLTIGAGSSDLAYLQNVALLQPFFLPGITKLTIQHTSNTDYSLPDISKSNVKTLDLQGFVFRSEKEWLHLPCSLEHLTCAGIKMGPSVLFRKNGDPFFGKLERLGLVIEPQTNIYVAAVCEVIIPLTELAMILHSAPGLTALVIGTARNTDTPPRLTIHCLVCNEMLAFHLRLLLKRHWDIASIKGATYCMDCNRRPGRGKYNRVVASLPRLHGITRCELLQSLPEDLRTLLELFPDLRDLGLTSCDDVHLDDHSLLVVAAQCPLLSHLSLTPCNNITPLGLLLLCQSRPKLTHIVCDDCDELPTPVLVKSMKILKGFNRRVVMVDTTPVRNVEA